MSTAPRAGWLRLLPLAALLAPTAAAQTLAWVRHAPVAGGTFGVDVEPAGDVDADGVPDVVVGAGTYLVPPWHSYVLSGRTSAVLLDLVGAGGNVCGPGDLSGDGVPDIAAISDAEPQGPLLAFSGADGAPLWSALAPAGFKDFASHSFDPAGDVNGDGVGDLFVGSGGLLLMPPVWGRVEVRSGAGGAQLWFKTGDSLAGDTGDSLAGLGDVNGDGVPDLVYTGVATISGTATTVARIVSGDDGHELLTVPGGDPQFAATAYCAAAGDADADGTPDIVSRFSGEPARVRSGATGAALFDLPLAYGTIWGKGRPHGVGDIDGDGFADAAGLGPPPPDVPFGFQGLHLYGGPDGTELHVYAGDVVSEGWGQAWAGVGDVDGDGRDDLAVTALEGGAGPPHGRVEIWGSGPPTLLQLDPPAASLGVLASSPQALRVTTTHAGDVLACDVDGTRVVLHDGLEIAGPMQLQLVLPAPSGLGPLPISALSAAGPGNTLDFLVRETQPPVLLVAPTLFPGRRSVWSFWGGAGDAAFLLTSGQPLTAPVQGWPVLAGASVLGVHVLDANGAGKHVATLPAGLAGLDVWSQVVTAQQGQVVGASGSTGSVIAP